MPQADSGGMEIFMMNELLEWLEYIEDVRQERKVKHKLKDIIVIVLFATLANNDILPKGEYSISCVCPATPN